MQSASVSAAVPSYATAPRRKSLKAQPPNLPAEHFALALVFLVCGALGLFVVAPELASGAFYVRRVVAVVHLFTLGFMVLSIFGALCQFLPVAVRRPLRFRGLAHGSFALQVSGVALFVLGLLFEQRALTLVGASLLSLAFLAFATNLVVTLASTNDRTLTWWALMGTAVFLVVTPAYGLMLALNLHEPGLVANRFYAVSVHAHVALVGIVLLTMVGVAHHLLPMFLLSHGASERAGWVALICLFAGAVLLAVPGFAEPLQIAGAGLTASGVMAFVAQAVSFFKHRKRRELDPGMRLAAAGIIGIVLALTLAPFALSRGLSDLNLLTAYFVLLLGAIILFIAGHYYKIIPFLVWYHRFGPHVGKRKLPKVAELYSAKIATLNGALLASGWLGLALATYAKAPRFAQLAAAVFALGAIVEAIMMVRIARRRVA